MWIDVTLARLMGGPWRGRMDLQGRVYFAMVVCSR